MANVSKQNVEALNIAEKDTLNAALQGNENEYGLDQFIDLLIKNSPK